MDRRTSSRAYLILLPTARRTFGKPPEPEPVKQPTPKPMTIERLRVTRRVPSLPTTPWQDDGR
jgi:hypothetical protein